MGIGEFARKIGDAVSDPLMDQVQELVNMAGHLAEEELWKRGGGAASGVPAPWNEAAENPAKKKAGKPERGALARAKTAEELGIDETTIGEMGSTAEDEKRMAEVQEAARKADWEKS